MGADFTDAGVLDEPGWGGGAACIDTSGNLAHVPKRERARAKARQIARHEKWRKAEAIRNTWSEEQVRQEQERLDREKEDILAGRRAA
jgi:hypothetical protein